ncbi:MAG TPA: Holliday junction resolvase RuvX [Verrucomicrobiae bacterium]|nr:Holliday junction resolvase RuvX [Verrucomicrobiae bacterium]
MNSNPHTIIALDVGEKRIGIAHADTAVKFPVPYGAIDVDGLEMERLKELFAEFEPATLVIGLPRNQQGEETAQTEAVRSFAARLELFHIPVVFQDESLTSVLAEKYLAAHKKRYSKADIDAHAAAIILGDYLEGVHPSDGA